MKSGRIIRFPRVVVVVFLNTLGTYKFFFFIYLRIPSPTAASVTHGRCPADTPTWIPAASSLATLAPTSALATAEYQLLASETLPTSALYVTTLLQYAPVLRVLESVVNVGVIVAGR